MKKIIVATISIIVAVIVIIAVANNLILKNRNYNNEIDNEIIDFDLMNIDLEHFDFNKFSLNDCERIAKDVINKHNNNEYSQYNSSVIQSKINRFKELIEVKKYYEEVSKCLNHIKKNATFEEQKELYYKTDEDIILMLCNTKNDWSLLKISNELYEKIMKQKGLLGDKDITKYYIDSKPPFKVQRVKLIYESEKQKVELIISKEIDYVYADEKSYGSEIISNFIIEDTINLTDNEGNEIDTRKVFTNENIKRNFEELCRDGDERGEMDYPDGEHYGYYGDDVAVSDNFRNKYPYFLDIFIHYSPLEYNKITLKELDIDNQIATFEVDSILECKRRTYDVKYILDNKMCLEDVDVQLSKEEVADMKKAEKQSAYYIFQNSNWSKLPVSDNFNKKFSSEKGVFYPLEIKQYKIDYTMKDNEYIYIYIYEFILKNDEKVFFSSVEVFDNKKLIDDVINERLPYDSSMTLGEVRDAYIRDYVENK